MGLQLQALSSNGEAGYRLEDRAIGYEIVRAPPADLRPLAHALAHHLAAVEASTAWPHTTLPLFGSTSAVLSLKTPKIPQLIPQEKCSG